MKIGNVYPPISQISGIASVRIYDGGLAAEAGDKLTGQVGI